MPDVTGAAEPSPHDQLVAELRRLLAMVLERAFGFALDKVEELARFLDDIAAHGGITANAALGGAGAALAGGNAIWGAIRGAVAAMSPSMRAALVLVLVLALVLLPVTVVLLLLAMIVIAVVAVAKAA